MIYVIIASVALIFWLDIATPRDEVSVSFLYGLPVFLAIFSNKIPAYSIAVLTTLLSCIGAFIQTPQETLDVVFFANRSIAIVAQWLVAFVVTTRKATEARLRADYEVERNKLETNRRFMDVLTHEIGTSLTMIDGQAFRLRRLGEIGEPLDLKARTEKIQAAVRQIEAVVRQVQLASEVGEGTVVLRYAPVPIADLIEDVVREVSDGRDIELKTEALPPVIQADADMIRQVFANLLSNAIKYSEADQRITIEGTTGQDEAVVSFIDEGRGIPEHECERLTEPYFRASNSHGVHGTGIGLYVARRFVVAHGGRLEFQSKLKQGTIAEVILPTRPKPEIERVSPSNSMH